MLQKLQLKGQFKTAEATGDLIGNKQLIQSLQQVSTFHQKKDKLLMILNCFEHEFDFLCIKMEFQKITNFLDTTSDDKDLPRFVTKNGLKFMINQKKITTLTKKLELKRQC